MPPSHPRPADLSALATTLSDTGNHCAEVSEELLDHMVTVGDHTSQAALEAVVDGAVDTLRELSATCQELVLSLGPEVHAGRTSDRSSPARTWEHR